MMVALVFKLVKVAEVMHDSSSGNDGCRGIKGSRGTGGTCILQVAEVYNNDGKQWYDNIR